MTRSTAHRTPLAPLWHTLILVALFLAVALAGVFSKADSSAAPSGNRLLGVYLPLLAAQWILLAYVCWPSPTLLRELVDRLRPKQLAREALVGFAAFLTVFLVGLCFKQPDAANQLLPRTHVEQLAWVLVALSAGLCEEVVFRGYLQGQFEAFSGSPTLAIAGQAALFGVAHGYQGWSASLQIAALGAALGLFARVIGNLRPGIVCHALTDLIAGFLPR